MRVQARVGEQVGERLHVVHALAQQDLVRVRVGSGFVAFETLALALTLTPTITLTPTPTLILTRVRCSKAVCWSSSRSSRPVGEAPTRSWMARSTVWSCFSRRRVASTACVSG